MAKLLFESSEENLKATENAQAAIVLASLASKKVLELNGLFSDGCAGHSLGEYSALVDGGVLSAEDALKAVTFRGRFMGEAASDIIKSKGEIGMAAVIGIGPEATGKAIENYEDVWSANENGPTQVVIAGTKSAIEAVTDTLKEAGS